MIYTILYNILKDAINFYKFWDFECLHPFAANMINEFHYFAFKWISNFPIYDSVNVKRNHEGHCLLCGPTPPQCTSFIWEAMPPYTLRPNLIDRFSRWYRLNYDVNVDRFPRILHKGSRVFVCRFFYLCSASVLVDFAHMIQNYLARLPRVGAIVLAKQ